MIDSDRKFLFISITTPGYDLQVKVTDLEIFWLSFWFQFYVLIVSKPFGQFRLHLAWWKTFRNFIYFIPTPGYDL